MSSPVGSARRSPADVVGSIVLLVLAWALLLCYGLVGLFLLAFLDHCPPESCSTDGAVNAIFLGGATALGLLVVVSIVAAVRLFAKRSVWWVGLLGLLAVAAGAALGIMRYAAAVG